MTSKFYNLEMMKVTLILLWKLPSLTVGMNITFPCLQKVEDSTLSPSGFKLKDCHIAGPSCRFGFLYEFQKKSKNSKITAWAAADSTVTARNAKILKIQIAIKSEPLVQITWNFVQ